MAQRRRETSRVRGRRTRRAAARRPGERAGLSRDEVLARARELAEREGVERLTMRRLAAELGVAPNALYTYFADMNAIVDAVLDRVLAELEPPEAAAGAWQETLAELMRASRRLLLRHPRLTAPFIARPGGPSAMRLGEITLQILSRGGVHGPKAVEALRALLSYTFGFVALEVPRLADPQRGERSTRAAALMEALPAEAFPATRSLARHLASHPAERDFEAGLRWLVRGIAEG